MRLTEQEKNRILGLHTNSKNVNGMLISEQTERESTTIYIVLVATTKNLKWKDEAAQKSNKWWEASHPDPRIAKAIKEWDARQTEEVHGNDQSWRPFKLKVRTEGQKSFSWEMGPFYTKKAAIKAKDRVEAFSGDWDGVTVLKQCLGPHDHFSMAETVPMDYECGGDVAAETDTDRFPNLELSDSLDLQKMPTFDPTKEGKVYKCGLEGCAAYVRSALDKYQGNAWHAHRMNDNLIYSTFKGNSALKKAEMEKLFTKINKSGGKLSDNADDFDSSAKNIAKSLVPSQSKFNDLEIDDVVGLYYDPSTMHSTAFFEGMTGYDDNGKGTKLGDGPFMVTKDGKEWGPAHLGKDVQFKAGKTLTAGNGPGLNTHLGFVGARNNGKPIIFHNIHGNVWATPLDKLNKNGTAIVWAKRGEGTTGPEVVRSQKIDSVKQIFNKYYNKYFD